MNMEDIVKQLLEDQTLVYIFAEDKLKNLISKKNGYDLFITRFVIDGYDYPFHDFPRDDLYDDHVARGVLLLHEKKFNQALRLFTRARREILKCKNGEISDMERKKLGYSYFFSFLTRFQMKENNKQFSFSIKDKCVKELKKAIEYDIAIAYTYMGIILQNECINNHEWDDAEELYYYYKAVDLGCPFAPIYISGYFYDHRKPERNSNIRDLCYVKSFERGFLYMAKIVCEIYEKTFPELCISVLKCTALALKNGIGDRDEVIDPQSLEDDFFHHKEEFEGHSIDMTLLMAEQLVKFEDK